MKPLAILRYRWEAGKSPLCVAAKIYGNTGLRERLSTEHGVE
jgi:hypothetical protein